MPQVSGEHMAMLNLPITLEEIKEVVGALEFNAALGPNGFTVEFYKKFKECLLQYCMIYFWHVPIEKRFQHHGH